MLKRTAVASIAIIALFATSLVATAAPGEKPDKPEKVEVCHIPSGEPGEAHTISIGGPARSSHLAHGDTDGACKVERPGRDDDAVSDDDDDSDGPISRR